MAPTIDWTELRRCALAAAEHSYAPYSGFHVGAAGLVDDGRVVSGCNIENASYGISLCAECTLVGALQMSGGGRLVAVVCVGNGAPVPPCGRCRQLLWEHAGPECLLDGDGTPRPLREFLPYAFPELGSFVPPPSP
jgi:cytidine deaminase